jgi:Sulfotransferase domain
MNKPNFLIIGAQKSGTSSLRKFMERNPNHFFTPRQELHFWNRDREYRDGEGVAEYYENFKGAAHNQIVGEKSPSYLPSSSAAERIAHHLPQVKIVAVLRDPVDRAHSAYLHGLRVGAIPRSRTFSQAIRNYQDFQGVPYGDVVSQGFYFENLERYFKFFHAKQIHVMSFSQLTQTPNLILPKLMNFLITPEFDYEPAKIDYSMPRVNVARTSRFPQLVRRVRASKKLSIEQKNYLSGLTFKKLPEAPILPEDRTFLDEIYAESNSNLQKRLGPNFIF